MKRQWIEHSAIKAGDVIELAGEPARVTSAATHLGYRRVQIERDKNGRRTTGTWYIRCPVAYLAAGIREW